MAFRAMTNVRCRTAYRQIACDSRTIESSRIRWQPWNQ